MAKQRAISLLFLFALLAPVAAMSQVLTGIVSSEGEPLVSANVVVRGQRGNLNRCEGEFYTQTGARGI
jgi:hypothetical protein